MPQQAADPVSKPDCNKPDCNKHGYSSSGDTGDTGSAASPGSSGSYSSTFLIRSEMVPSGF